MEISEWRKKYTPGSNTSISSQEQKKPFHAATLDGPQSPDSFQLFPAVLCNYFRGLDPETWPLQLQTNNLDSVLLNILLINAFSGCINPRCTRATHIPTMFSVAYDQNNRTAKVQEQRQLNKNYCNFCSSSIYLLWIYKIALDLTKVFVVRQNPEKQTSFINLFWEKLVYI